MSEGCMIRPADATEVDVLADIYRRSSLSNDGDRNMLLAHADVLEFAGDGIADGRTRVATVNGTVVGFSTTLDAGGVVDLEDLFVDPAWMRKGIGLALMRDVVERARERGARVIEVTANPHALAFYARAGFVPYGTAETRFGAAERLQIDLRQ